MSVVVQAFLSFRFSHICIVASRTGRPCCCLHTRTPTRPTTPTYPTCGPYPTLRHTPAFLHARLGAIVRSPHLPGTPFCHFTPRSMVDVLPTATTTAARLVLLFLVHFVDIRDYTSWWFGAFQEGTTTDTPSHHTCHLAFLQAFPACHPTPAPPDC